MKQAHLALLVFLAALASPIHSVLPAQAQVVRTACTPTAPDRLSPYWPASVTRWEKLVALYATREGIDPDLVAAVMRHESAGNPDSVSEAGAVGLMQVMPQETGFALRPTAQALRDPATNIHRGTLILSQVISDAHGDLRSALGAYNGGWGGYDHQTPQAYAGWVLADYGRALATRHCLPEPDGLAWMIASGKNPPQLTPESGCRLTLLPPAYKSDTFSVHLLLISCGTSIPVPTRTRYTGERD